jgi:hypothetical protein
VLSCPLCGQSLSQAITLRTVVVRIAELSERTHLQEIRARLNNTASSATSFCCGSLPPPNSRDALRLRSIHGGIVDADQFLATQ